MGCETSAAVNHPQSVVESRQKSAAVYDEQSGLPIKSSNCVDHVRILYFPVMGKVDPLIQMFEFHGQPYEKLIIDFAYWTEMRKTGTVGEFDRLPIITIVNRGREIDLG